MKTWSPATRDEVERYLREAVTELHPTHLRRFEAMRIPLRQVPIEDSPGEYVYVVAEHYGKIVYWSDVEEGWELEQTNENGSVPERRSNQFTLSQILYQVLGDPAALA